MCYVLICDIFIVYIYFFIAFIFLEVIGTFVPETPIFALKFVMKMIKRIAVGKIKIMFCLVCWYYNFLRMV